MTVTCQAKSGQKQAPLASESNRSLPIVSRSPSAKREGRPRSRPRGRKLCRWLGELGPKVSGAHLFQNEERKQGGEDIHRHRNAEHGHPASGRDPHRSRNRTPKNRTDALGDVEEAVVRGRVAASERVGERRGKQGKDLAPAEEDEARKYDERRRRAA